MPCLLYCLFEIEDSSDIAQNIMGDSQIRLLSVVIYEIDMQTDFTMHNRGRIICTKETVREKSYFRRVLRIKIGLTWGNHGTFFSFQFF